MKKSLYIFITFFLLTNNLYADVQIIGRCIGFLTSKTMYEGQSSLTQPNLKWLKANYNDFQVVNKIVLEQKNCVIIGQPYKHCLSGYSNYDAQLYIEASRGAEEYNRIRYDQARRTLYELACEKY